MKLITFWCPRRESNSHFILRTDLFYPLNYGGLLSNILISLNLLFFSCKRFNYLHIEYILGTINLMNKDIEED